MFIGLSFLISPFHIFKYNRRKYSFSNFIFVKINIFFNYISVHVLQATWIFNFFLIKKKKFNSTFFSTKILNWKNDWKSLLLCGLSKKNTFISSLFRKNFSWFVKKRGKEGKSKLIQILRSLFQKWKLIEVLYQRRFSSCVPLH